MINQAHIHAETAARDPVAERAERQMRAMERLSEVGLDLARALRAQVCDDGPVVMAGDPAQLFVRIARAVRQCIALEAKIGEALREWLGLSEAERAERRAAVAARADAAPEEADPPEMGEGLDERGSDARSFDRERHETERGERPERLWADSYVIEDEGSFLDIVARVCRDLGVAPDWSGWADGGPGDLAVRVDDGGARGGLDLGLGLGLGLDLAPRPSPAAHGASQRGPPT